VSAFAHIKMEKLLGEQRKMLPSAKSGATPMTVATTLRYDICQVTQVSPVSDGLRITFADGSNAFLDAGHPNFDVLRINAEWACRYSKPVGVIVDPDGRIVDLYAANDTTVRYIQEDATDHNRLTVAFWAFGPICYLTRDHPEFERIRATLTEAAGTSQRVWFANHSEMVHGEPTTQDGEFEIWWKIMDVRPMEPEPGQEMGDKGHPG
jgi:hypothetical protein